MLSEAIKAVGKFALHTVVGIALFSVIAVAAVALHHLVIGLETWGAPDYVIYVMRTVEFVIFAADMVLCGLYLMKEILALGKQICLEIRAIFV